MIGQPGFSDLDERYAALSAAGDPLERPGAVVDFELFRSELDTMFKILLVQTLYTLSDDQTEYQIRDRLSFMRFLGWRCTIPCRTPKPSGGSASS
jgi:IS5 family transposase